MVKLPGIGDEFAGYRIEGLLGKGGMGVVYLARHLSLDRSVALKLLPEGLTDDSSFRARFERESRLAARMEHPNIVPIYEAGEHEQLLYIVMRYVPGADLKQVIAKEGALSPERALGLVAQAANALDAAHSKELVHRDVKPHNMLIAPPTGWSPEHLYLTDFGLAKKTSSSVALTATGSFMGTVFYVAPEQVEGTAAVGPKADVYSLGCVLFEALTGDVPFDGETDMSVVGAHLTRAPPKASERANLPPAIDDVIATAMAKDPSERYALCTAMVADARSVLAEAGWDVGSTAGPKAVSAEEPREHTLAAPAPVVPGETPGAQPAPRFRFGEPGLPPVTDGAVAPAASPERKPRRWLLPALTVVGMTIAGVVTYLLLFTSSEERAAAPITFAARATSEMPEALPRRVDGFRFTLDKTELVEVLKPLKKLGAAYQLTTSQTFVNHYVALYRSESDAADDLADQIAFLRRQNFSIVERAPLENARGGVVGDVVLMRRTEPRDEEAVAWTNERLSVGARGAPGQALDFFTASSY